MRDRHPAADKLFEVGRRKLGQIHRPESFLTRAAAASMAQVVALFAGE